MTQHKGSIIKRSAPPQMFRDGLGLCTGGPEEHSVLMDDNDFICRRTPPPGTQLNWVLCRGCFPTFVFN